MTTKPETCTLVCPDDTTVSFPCDNMPKDPCAGHSPSGAQEVPCKQWCQADKPSANGTIAVWCCDKAHTPTYPMPASPYIPTGSMVSEPVTLSTNSHGNITVTHANGIKYGLAFVNGKTVSYPLYS